MSRDKRVETLEARRGQGADPVTTIELIGVSPDPKRTVMSVATWTLGHGHQFTPKGAAQ